MDISGLQVERQVQIDEKSELYASMLTEEAVMFADVGGNDDQNGGLNGSYKARLPLGHVWKLRGLCASHCIFFCIGASWEGLRRSPNRSSARDYPTAETRTFELDIDGCGASRPSGI